MCVAQKEIHEQFLFRTPNSALLDAASIDAAIAVGLLEYLEVAVLGVLASDTELHPAQVAYILLI